MLNKKESLGWGFNLGTGKGVSVLEIINAFEKATGLKLPYEITPRREGDIEKVWADTSLCQQGTGLARRYSFGRYSCLLLEVGMKLKERREKEEQDKKSDQAAQAE